MNSSEQLLRMVLRAYVRGGRKVQLDTEWSKGFCAALRFVEDELDRLETSMKVESSSYEEND